MTEPEVRTVRSFCRICTAICGILVDVAGDEVLRVRGDKDHPLSRGYTCPKGRALPRVHHHPDRIERPMVRVDGQLQPAEWETCLDDVAGRLRRIIDRHGPEAIGVYFGSGLDPAIRRGAASVPHGHHTANVNVLTDKDVIDPVTGMVRYSCVPVVVEPAPAG